MEFLHLLCLCIFLSSEQFAAAAQEDGLQYLQIVFRHGDRSPIRLFPTDPNPEEFWPEGLGKLSQLGKKQHYILGTFLRQTYADFITTSPNEIDVLSSEVDRCFRSAEVNLASFYAPRPDWMFTNDILWQPIPAFSFPVDEDKYLETGSYCPRAFEEEKRIVESPEGQEIINHYKELFGNLTVFCGSDVDDWKSASYIFDTLKIEKKYNLSIPAWANTYWEQLHHITDMSFYWSFNSKLMQRLRAGPLLGLIRDNMKMKTSNETFKDKKVQIFSAHDTNVAVLLDALDLFNWKQPPYCSALVFELHRYNGSHFVRLLYLNSSAPELKVESPHVLVIDGCLEFCPLEFFVNFTKDIIPEDWSTECQLKSSFLDKFSVTGLIVATIFVALAIIVVILICIALLKRSQGRENYSYHLMSNMPS